jgi:hypothetical protein
MLLEDLFYVDYVEQVLEKEARSISTMNHDVSSAEEPTMA